MSRKLGTGCLKRFEKVGQVEGINYKKSDKILEYFLKEKKEFSRKKRILQYNLIVLYRYENKLKYKNSDKLNQQRR